MSKQELPDDSRQWDYTDAAQRILIAERCRAMLDGLAGNMPLDASEGFAALTNAKVSVEHALAQMRGAASTATALHACTACGRHPDTYVEAEAGEVQCQCCGLGGEK